MGFSIGKNILIKWNGTRKGIFKAQKDSNGKETPATYQLKSLYMVGSDDKNDQN